MNFKKIGTVILSALITVSMSACGNNNTAETTKSTSANTTAVSENTDNTTSAETTTTAAVTTTTTTVETNGSDTNNKGESVTVYYGWDIDDMDYVAEIYCPEGAYFHEYTLEVQANDGRVFSADVRDDVNEYWAISNSYWPRDAYVGDVSFLSILQQLYFDGEIDAETAKEYSGCSQKVTPLGFKWKGYDVILIETTYTFMDYPEQTDLFVGVEYDLNYWKVDENTSETIDLTTKGLFGFDVFSSGFDKLTQEQCAWIAGGLFGVDCGIENPFTNKGVNSGDIPTELDPSALIGTWFDKDSGWGDTYFFDSNGYGSYTSGFESTFSYSVEGNILTVFYAEDDIDIFTAIIDGETLILIDEYEYEQRFEKLADDSESSDNSEDDSNPNVTAIIGTWKEDTTGTEETFTFNADGTGYYSCLNEDGIYECGFTYNFFTNDYVDIYFDDGDIAGFLLFIDADTMTIKNDFIDELAYTRQ